MATGTLNSQSTVNQPGKTAVAGDPGAVPLRSGEAMATTQAALADKNSKTYHHMVAGAQFVMPDGLSVLFLGGQLTTNDPAIVKELDKVADKPTSQIYTAKANQAVVKAATSVPAEEVLAVAKPDIMQQ